MKKYFFFKQVLLAAFSFLAAPTFAQPPQPPAVVNDTLPPVHDPVMIRQDSTYYVFCTGFGVSVFSSTDRKHWTQLKPVFDKAPAWAVKAIPDFKGHIWAPDISYHNGL